jgi:hypothetical protein
MRCPQSRPATISCRQTMTASKTFGGVAGIGGAGIGAAGIGGAGERRRFESRLSLTYTITARPQNVRMGRRMHDQWPPSRQRHAAALDDTWTDFRIYSISRKTISEKWPMLDAGVHVRNCPARRSTSHC